MEEQIRELLQLSGKGIEASIISYSHWFFISAICWLIFGSICFITIFIIWKLRNLWKEWEFMGFIIAAMIILGIIGLLTIPVNLPTLISPQAYATHQIIGDIRGN